jgi:hypothetical protein
LKERKYFDSGDYALSKAGKASSVDTGSVGSQHPLPENIPHLSSPGVGNASQGGSGNGNIHLGSSAGLQSGSPVKESSFLNRETSVDEMSVPRLRRTVFPSEDRLAFGIWELYVKYDGIYD